MISFIKSLEIISPIFIIMCFGTLCKLFKLIDDSYIGTSNRLLFYLFLPVFLFTKISSSHLKQAINLRLVSGCYVAILVTFLLSVLVASLNKYDSSTKGTFVQGAFRGNIGYIGLAIVMSAYGEKALFTASILLGMLTPLINFLAILSFVLPNKQRTLHNLYSLLKDVVLNPIIISSILGIFFNIFNIPIPDVLKTSFNYISKVTLPLALFIIGASFKQPNFDKNLMIPLWCNFIKLIVMPFLTFIILYLLNVKSTDLYIGLIFAAAPTAVVTYVFASQFKGDMELASIIVITSVIFSFFTYPLLFHIFKVIRI